jgi:hypothetical protein
VMARAVEPRTTWSAWCDSTVLRDVPWSSGPLPEVLRDWWLPGDEVADLFDGSFGDDDIPAEPTWPVWTPSTPLHERARTWATAVLVEAWERHGTAEVRHLRPASRIELLECEHRIDHRLPASLRAYHLALGASGSVEGILPVTAVEHGGCVGPLLETFPGLLDLLTIRGLDRPEARRQVADLVAFGDYLGNGNLWCFSRETGAVWYVDHDGPEPFTRMFDDVGDYFDALTVVAAGRAREVLGGEDESERVLAARLGRDRVRTWMY